MSDQRIAPHRLDLVIDFVNTVDLETAEEALADRGGLATWLTDRGLLADGESVSDGQLAAALDLREALRAAMLANNGGPEEPSAAARIEQAARRGELSVHFR